MPAHAQTPDLSLPPLPDLNAGLDAPSLPLAADAPMATEPVPTLASQTAQPAVATTSTSPVIGGRATADAIDDLLPPVATKPAGTDAAPPTATTTSTPAQEVPVTQQATGVAGEQQAAAPSLPPLPDVLEPIQPMSLADEARAKGVPALSLPLPPTSEPTAQAILSGRPLGADLIDDEPEVPVQKVKRKPGVRDLPKLRPSFQPVRNAYNYQRVVLPPSLYKREYSPENRHLPRATTREDYDRHLFGAVAANDVNTTRAFLEMGKSVNLANAGGETLLMTAVRYGSLDTMRLLLARGADPRMAGSNGMTPLQMAESSGQRTMAEVLRARGA